MNRKSKRGFLGRLFSWVKKFLLFTLLSWVLAIMLFKFLPVPYTAVMLDRQMSAWLSQDATYHANKVWVSDDEIAPNMLLAVIAGEDQKFLTHWGLDFAAITSVINHNEARSRPLRGASTISQQMVKNLFLWDGRSWLRKGLEAGLTLAVELAWGKKRIITVYLNIVEFGDGVFGVEAAANQFFNKPAQALTLEEAALLAAVLPNPHIFKVDAPSAYVLQRQKWIIKQMRQLGGLRLIKDL